ncbi:hypothetical protein ElyMa_004290700 [Elysia marginata]|uniref:Uncharacterized protein n=1 Tax=Elysia marginata TaxID=1093978 RepID=A0AAV4GWX0_9GAST|nr:hypothetical protein ElyMa_004290700 [Elysia marginata]
MLHFQTFVLLVIGAWSLQLPADAMSTVTPPKPCCVPAQWQGALVDLKSQDDVVSTVVYDYVKKMEGSWTTMRATGQLVAHSLIDYGAVHDSQITEKVYLGSNTLGLKGMGIDYDSFSFKADGAFVTVSLAAVPGTTDLCIPVLESIKDDAMDVIYMYLQMTTSIADPSIMTLPAPCVRANVGVVG